jgi:hypothetical protein
MPKSIRGVMSEFKGGQLHSGSSNGPVVTNRKQAVAIGISEQKPKGHPHANLGKYLHPKKGKS